MKRIVATGATVLAALLSVPAAAQAGSLSAAGSTIVIREATTHGPRGLEDEYIEFQNVTDTTIDVSGYRLRFTPPVGRPVEFASYPEGVSYQAGQVFLYIGEEHPGAICAELRGEYDMPDSGVISLHEPDGMLVASIRVPQNPPPPPTPCA